MKITNLQDDILTIECMQSDNITVPHIIRPGQTEEIEKECIQILVR